MSIRYFDDGTRVGFEFDDVRDAKKLTQDEEQLKALRDALTKLDTGRFEKVSELTKNIITDMSEAQAKNAKEVAYPIQKEVKKSNTLAKVAIGVSGASLLILVADKSVELYKKFKSTKTSAKKPAPVTKK